MPKAERRGLLNKRLPAHSSHRRPAIPQPHSLQNPLKSQVAVKLPVVGVDAQEEQVLVAELDGFLQPVEGAVPFAQGRQRVGQRGGWDEVRAEVSSATMR
jgi:hypothetical protein